MKMNKAVKSLITAAVLVLSFGFILNNDDIYFEIGKNLELFGKVYKEISFNYVDEIDPKEFLRAGIKGMLSQLDPYTTFIDEKNQEDIDLITNGKYGGIGISIGLQNEKITVMEVLEGYSAQKQGIRIGDIIIGIDDKNVNPDKMDEISALVKGEPGTSVKLKILRSSGVNDTLVFNLVREDVVIKNVVFADFYPENSHNAYIKLNNFSRTAGDELRSALSNLKNKGEIKSIVLDLRGNPGGLLDVAVDICNKFLRKDLLIVSTRGKDVDSEKKYYALEEPMVETEKLVILINGSSASASEIVAGAIQDHDRGIILGTESFGKGLVQTIVPLSFNTSLKITTAKYYTPSGRCIQKIDYSKDNIVFFETDSLKKDLFSTDNKRPVFSAGAITPDTIVNEEEKCGLLKDLLAKGKIFSFADEYFYKHEKEEFNNLNFKKLESEFKEFLIKSNYAYHSVTEKKLDEVIADLTRKETRTSIKNILNKLKEELDGLFEKEFSDNKGSLLNEIRIEIATRFLGRIGAVKEKLKVDNQFLTALDLLNNDAEYSRLLSFNTVK